MSAREVLQAVRLPMEIVGGDDGRKVILYGEIGPQGIDAILSALDAAGYAVVPKEPTEEMLRAYYQCMEGTHPTARMNPDKYLTHNLKANTRWRAMLTAAKETP